MQPAKLIITIAAAVHSVNSADSVSPASHNAPSSDQESYPGYMGGSYPYDPSMYGGSIGNAGYNMGQRIGNGYNLRGYSPSNYGGYNDAPYGGAGIGGYGAGGYGAQPYGIGGGFGGYGAGEFGAQPYGLGGGFGGYGAGEFGAQPYGLGGGFGAQPYGLGGGFGGYGAGGYGIGGIGARGYGPNYISSYRLPSTFSSPAVMNNLPSPNVYTNAYGK